MNALRALGLRMDLPRRPARSETDSADLTTLAQRENGAVAPDALHVMAPREFWTPLNAPVPGRLIEGTLPEDHYARFTLRMPKDWNGRLVVAASSGITDERTYDLYFSDYFLSRGFAFAATDKGVRRAVLDGDTMLLPLIPESSARRWFSRLEDLARVAGAAALDHYGRRPAAVYAVGLSNGGHLARKAAESDSGLFDGALEVSGVFWSEGQNLLRQLPAALRAAAGTPPDAAALARAGFPAGEGRWAPVLELYRQVYWKAVLHLFIGDLDPAYDGAVEDYDLDARPASVRSALGALANTGDLKVPLISIAGTHDFLISARGHALAYRDLVASRGKGGLHRLILVENASHIDTNRQTFDFIPPLMPRAHEAFEELVALVEGPAPATGPSSPRRR